MLNVEKKNNYNFDVFDGVLFRTKNFKPDYRYTKNFIDLWSIDELILVDISKKNPNKFLEIINFLKKIVLFQLQLVEELILRNMQIYYLEMDVKKFY